MLSTDLKSINKARLIYGIRSQEWGFFWVRGKAEVVISNKEK